MKANAKEIPEAIRDLIKQKYNANPERLNTGKRSSYPGLARSLHEFSKSLKNRTGYAYIAFEFQSGVSLERVQRAFGHKTPKDASKVFRDLLCLYATDGECDWNRLLIQMRLDSDNPGLLDEDEVTILEVPSNHPATKEEIASLLREYRAEVPEREYGIIEKQVLRDNQLIGDMPERVQNVLTVPSHKNPMLPEFPPIEYYHPSFPASLTYRIRVPGFSNVWLKDESTNPTGTHKDRMAWEVTLNALRWKIPEISIISSGSAAIAIKFFFNLYDVPTKVKVLVDSKLEEEVKSALVEIGCEIYETDLSLRELKGEQIRELTKNKEGFDITYRETMDPYSIIYYDWASYEILNTAPEYCFVPFGTGDLYTNILKVIEVEFNSMAHDPRLQVNLKTAPKCHFLAASTENARSKLDKLFSYYLPSLNRHRSFIANLKDAACIGPLSDIYFVDESFVDQAVDIAIAEDVTCEPSGIAGLALLLQQKDSIPKDSKILIVNTGKTKYYPIKPPKKDIYAKDAKHLVA